VSGEKEGACATIRCPFAASLVSRSHPSQPPHGFWYAFLLPIPPPLLQLLFLRRCTRVGVLKRAFLAVSCVSPGCSSVSLSCFAPFIAPQCPSPLLFFALRLFPSLLDAIGSLEFTLCVSLPCRRALSLASGPFALHSPLSHSILRADASLSCCVSFYFQLLV